tara:strand:+ start:1797 stop:2933 length:1137 start_codon:yes stop_codon:yes gene_type:complete
VRVVVIMSAILEKIASIELEMSRTQKNKATENHLGSLRAKLAQLRRELIEPSGKSGGKGEGFEVTKTGDCRVGLVGFPSVGKSTLLTKLTGVHSEAAAYEFTTLTCVPGVINYRGARVQLLDLPGIIEGAKDGKGRGRQVISTARTCDVIVVVLDAMKPLTHRRLIEKELDGFGIRLNKKPPNISYTVKDKGGVNVLPFKPKSGEDPAWLDESTVKAILEEYHVKNCDVKIYENCTDEELIDVIEGNRIYTPCVYAVNKIDQITVEELELLDAMPHYVPVSSGKEWNLDGLLDKIWEYLNLTRIYTKPKGQNPAYDAPIILKKGQVTVEDFCNSLHKSMVKNFKEANVWGMSAKHRPQKVGKEHVLCDEDVVQIVKKI